METGQCDPQSPASGLAERLQRLRALPHVSVSWPTDAVHAEHADVHDEQIGLECLNPLDGGLAGIGLSDHLVALVR